MLLLDGKPVLGIVVEAQVAADARKRFAWPAYAIGLRARIHCPVCLLVVTHDDAVARWCAKPIDLGGGNHFTPLVLGPAGVPVVTSAAQAKADPELAILAEIVLKLLTLKFGALSASAKKRVATAGVAQLDRIAERVLSAKTLSQVFASKTKPTNKKR